MGGWVRGAVVAAAQCRVPVAAAAMCCLPAAAVALPAVVHGPRHARMEVQAQIQVDEGRLFVQQEARIAADQPAALALDPTDPLWLPLLAPVVGEVVLDRAALPAQTQALQVESDGPLKILRTRGGVQLVGRLDPNQTASVRSRLQIDLAGPDLELALRGAGVQAWASVVLVAQAPARPTLQSLTAARHSRYDQGRERLAGAVLVAPIGNGDSARFHLGDLPVPAEAPRRALTWAAGLLAVLAACWLVAGLGRRGDDGA
ncbi:MAG: hypothetical protein FJ100_05765 [Deltaproteobacteria bacterium]|nr:hypothetical protein [Deltaproteobacteria bacterium]